MHNHLCLLRFSCMIVAVMIKGKKLLTLILILAALFLAVVQLISLILINVRIRKVFEHSTSSSSKNATRSDYYTEDPSLLYKTIKEITECYDRSLEPTIDQHGAYWVFHNYVQAEKQYHCYESITYTTQGDYSFLENLIPVLERWRGPISVALHTPGTDFEPTLKSIAYLRNCKSPLFKKFVTFHIFFESGHLPTTPLKKPYDVPIRQLYRDVYDCRKGAPYANVNYTMLYKTKANISYPINVARNVARENSQTYFLLAADIELYPSPNTIHQFLRMVMRRRDLFEVKDEPMIFVLPVFEVLEDQSVPKNKETLKEMIKKERAFSFHKRICNHCHAIPHLKQWLHLNVSEELDVFTMSKRQGPHDHWEAFYIGTNAEPSFDERMDWERHGNKMPQAYAMCLLDYNYMVLDNAFLVHKPGIKQKMVNAEVIPQTAKYINKYLSVELNILYGKRKGCRA